MKPRRKCRQIAVGGLLIGGDAAVSIQSMTNTKTSDLAATISQIDELYKAGCELVRVSVPDMESAKTISMIKEHCPMPLSADVHFDHRLALAAIEYGADKLRINPGNMAPEHVEAIAKAAKAAHIPIRVGVNGGSLPADIIEKLGHGPDALAEAAIRSVRLLEQWDFEDIIISVKASNPVVTIEANEILASETDYPLHLGVTEAGPGLSGAVKSSVGIGALLYQGIGDTIRVAVTENPVDEIPIAKEILRSLGLRNDGVQIISCPTCARCGIDLIPLAKRVQAACSDIKEPLAVAVMGCAVNGPGEAREADVGIAAGSGKGVLFKKGQIIRTVTEDELFGALMTEIGGMIGD